MNLTEIKAMADQKEIENNKIEELKVNILEIIKNYKEEQDAFHKDWSNKMKETINKYIVEYKDWFISNGFTISEITISSIDATYKTETFRLSNINYDGEIMYLQNIKASSSLVSIEFRIDSIIENSWKPIIVGGKREIDYYNKDFSIDYNGFISSLDTIEKLDEVKRKYIENIENDYHTWKILKESPIYIINLKNSNNYTNMSDFLKSIFSN